ncbi:Lipid-A-disaccharide synthase [Aquimixticola soesokkakensis]|uniref:Lipid-A-disaccharide synthase n=1 Tax=Aquimixticola soesokkakensis TaxID=1519096 RepID=A0A1Y5SG13_9RHOB|nr:lipid-A-disaccharide synthase [Aquimixticola soesokkakensis]SLN39964.1 Lipid-A-disaccharide synthase [Aquimixticola soesokkakensis]
MTLKVFIIAGEPSGDQLGAAVMAGLRELTAAGGDSGVDTGVEFRGIGGDAMQAAGLSSLFDMSELSVMGLAEVLPKYGHLVRRKDETANAIVKWHPDLVLTIDSPDFCLRVVEAARKQVPDLRFAHYVAPTVWAWRPERAAKMKRTVDQVLALFPFEPPHFQREGLRCDFVGHPVVAQPQASAAEIATFRSAHGLKDRPLVLVLPGSRRGEVNRLAPTFGAALGYFAQSHPNAAYVLPVAGAVAEDVKRLVADWPVKPILIAANDAARKRAAFGAADVALAASGTVSLELAAARTPMVVAYDMNWLTRQIVKRKLLVDTVTLVNLVSETRVVPEFLGERCQPGPIALELGRVMDAPEDQYSALDVTMERLGRGGEAPGLRAARALLEGMPVKS